MMVTTLLRSDLGRGANHSLIKFDSENVRFLPLENSANELLACFGVGDDTDERSRRLHGEAARCSVE
jgi:hypothetical protein